MSLIKPNANRAVLLDLQWVGTVSDPNEQRTLYLTSNTEPLTVGNKTYTPEPSIEVSLPSFDGGVENKKATVRMTRSLPLLQKLALGRSHQKVTMRVRQLTWDPTDLSDNTVTTVWQGDIVAAEINPEGKAGAAEIQLTPCGGGMDRVVNPICSDRCWKKFGDTKNCKVDRAALAETVRIDAISGLNVTITSATAPTASPANRWAGGDMNFGGVRVKIRSWSVFNPLVFELGEYPPQEFMDVYNPAVSQATDLVEIRPGCDRSVQACRGYGNEVNYGGVGLVMPLRNPNLEIGD